MPHPFGRICRRAELRLTHIGARSASADLSLYDAEGEIVAELTDCWFRRVALGRTDSARRAHVSCRSGPRTSGRQGLPRRLRGGRHRLLARLVAAKASDPERRDTERAARSHDRRRRIPSVAHASSTPDRPFRIDESSRSPDAILRHRQPDLAECLLRSVERLGGAREDQWRMADRGRNRSARRRRDLAAAVGRRAGSRCRTRALGEALDRLARPSYCWTSDGRSRRCRSMVEHFVDASPASAAGIDMLGEALSAIAARWPSDRPLRILEIGAEPKVTRRFLQLFDEVAGRDRLCRDEHRCRAIRSPFRDHEVLRLALRHVVGCLALRRTLSAISSSILCSRQIHARACGWMLQHWQGCATCSSRAGCLLRLSRNPMRFGISCSARMRPGGCGIVGARRSRRCARARSGKPNLPTLGLRMAAAASLTDGPWPVAAFWGNAPPVANPVAVEPVPSRTIAVIAEDTPLSRALMDRLEADGHCVALARSRRSVRRRATHRRARGRVRDRHFRRRRAGGDEQRRDSKLRLWRASPVRQ